MMGRHYWAFRRQLERSQRLVRKAIKEGRLVRPDICEACGKRPDHSLHGHHHNGYTYAHALDVQWLCRSCHSRTQHPWQKKAEERDYEEWRSKREKVAA